jgi:hypothetical protein
MQETKRATREEGLKKGYLKNKKIKLIPLIDRGMTLITADKKNSLHSFSYDGAVRHYPLAMDDKFNLRDPFDNDDERFFFESYFGRNLGTTSNSWFRTDESIVKLSLDASFKQNGYIMDMSNPEDVLRYKILTTQDDIAPSLEATKNPLTNKPHWKFVLVDEGFEDTQNANKAKAQAAAWMEYGRITDSKEKMIGFLEVYLANNKKLQEIPADPTQDFLMNEMFKILESDKEGLLETSRDPDFEIKQFVIKAVKLGVVEKQGVNQYNLPGETKFTYNEFIDYIKLAKEQKDTDPNDVYGKILTRMDTVEGIKNSKFNKKK